MTHTPDARPVSEERLAEMMRRAQCDPEFRAKLIRAGIPFGSLASTLESLRAEVERLRTTGTESFRLAVYHQDRADKAEARIASLEKDAVELRELLKACRPHVHLLVARNPHLQVPRALVAAIDAAMKQGKERV